MARDKRIDSIKGLLIVLVILGHVITTLDNFNHINHAVMGLIYIFHMPLFIIISGYLTKNPAEQSARDMWRGVGNIAITLIIFQALSVIRLYFQGSSLEWALKCFPYGVLWYILCLIYWRILLYYTPKALLKRPALYLGLALIVTLVSGFTHLGNYLALQRGLNFYFFFLLGYYYRQGQIPSRWWKANVLYAALIIVLLPIIFWLYPHCGNIMNGADRYTISDLPQKLMILTCSVSLSLLVFNLMREFKLFTHLGKDSLFYYLYHFFIISLLIKPAVTYFNLPNTLPFMLLHTVIIVAVIYLMGKVPLFRWLTGPYLKRGTPAK